MINNEYQSDFEDLQIQICSPHSIFSKDADGTYWDKGTRDAYSSYIESRLMRDMCTADLTEADKLAFIRFINVHRVTCYFEGQKLIVPTGQGRSVPLAVYIAFDMFKYQKNRLAG